MPLGDIYCTTSRPVLRWGPTRFSQGEWKCPAGPDTPRKWQGAQQRLGQAEALHVGALPQHPTPRSPSLAMRGSLWPRDLAAHGVGVRGRGARTLPGIHRAHGFGPPGSPTSMGRGRPSRSASWRPLPSTCSWRPPAAQPCPAWPCSMPCPYLPPSCTGCQVGPGWAPVGGLWVGRCGARGAGGSLGPGWCGQSQRAGQRSPSACQSGPESRTGVEGVRCDTGMWPGEQVGEGKGRGLGHRGL